MRCICIYLNFTVILSWLKKCEDRFKLPKRCVITLFVFLINYFLSVWKLSSVICVSKAAAQVTSGCQFVFQWRLEWSDWYQRMTNHEITFKYKNVPVTENSEQPILWFSLYSRKLDCIQFGVLSHENDLCFYTKLSELIISKIKFLFNFSRLLKYAWVA